MIERPEKFVRALDKSKERDDKRELNNRLTHTPPDAHSLLIVPSRRRALSLVTHGTKLSVLIWISTTPHAPPYAYRHPTPFDNVLNRWNFEISELDGRFQLHQERQIKYDLASHPPMEFTLTNMIALSKDRGCWLLPYQPFLALREEPKYRSLGFGWYRYSGTTLERVYGLRIKLKTMFV
jgi:hypothetical protein